MATTQNPQVVVEFVPDISQVESSIAELQKKGELTDNAAQAYSKGNTELQKRYKILQDTNKVTNTLTDSQKKQAASVSQVEKAVSSLVDEFMAGVGEGMAQAAKESGISVQDLIKKIQGMSAATGEAVDKEESLKKKLREMKAEIAQLLVDEKKWTDTDRARYNELVELAGRYNDAINDTSETVTRAGSDTRGFDNIIDGAQGVAAGFAVAQGTAALFGEESEQVQQTLLKVNAAMAVLQGLQQLQDLAEKQYIITIANKLRLQVLGNAQTAIASALESEYTIVRVAATVAQRALNAAMAANPVGLLVTVLATAAIALFAFTKNSNDAAESQKKLAEEANAAFEAIQKENEILNTPLQNRIKQTERELEQAKARRASSEEIYKIEQKLADQRQNLAAANKGYYAQEISDIGVNQAKLEALYQDRAKLAGKDDDDSKKREESLDNEISLLEKKVNVGIAAEKDYNDAVSSGTALRLDHEKQSNDKALQSRKATIEAALASVKQGTDRELQLKIALVNASRDIDLNDTNLTQAQRQAIIAKSEKEIRDLRMGYRQVELKDEKDVIDLRVLYAKKGSRDELDNRIKQIELERDIELQNAALTANERALIEGKAAKEIFDLKKQFNYDEAKNASELEVIKAQNRVLSFQQGTQQYYDAQRVFLQKQAANDMLAVNQSEDTEQEKAAKLLQINLKLNQDLDALDKQRYEQQINAQYERNRSLDQLEVNRLVRLSGTLNLSERDRFLALQASRQKELKLIEDENAKVDQLVATGVITFQEYEAQKTDLKDKEEQKRFEIVQAYAERERAIREAVITEGFKIASDAISTIADMENTNRQSQLDSDLARLKAQYDAEVSNKNLSEAQKAAIDKRYRDDERRIKTAAFIKDRNAQVTLAIINGALAVTNALATVKPFYAAIIAAAGAGITAGLQVAKIRNTPIPQYFTGTRSAKKGYAWVGERGPEIVKLNGGEIIYNDRESTKIGKVWDNVGVHSDPDAILAGNLPKQSARELSDYHVTKSGEIIDYEKLGKSIAKYMPENKAVSVNADIDGFSIHIHDRNTKTEILNNKYSAR